LQLLLDEFEGVVGFLGVGLVGFEVCYGCGAVFGCYGDFGVES
jgi:hypothetical protein